MFLSKTTNFAMNIFDAVCTECGGWNSASMTKKLAYYNGNAGRGWPRNAFRGGFWHFSGGPEWKVFFSSREKKISFTHLPFPIVWQNLAAIRRSYVL